MAVLDKDREMRSNFTSLILKPRVKPVPVGLPSGAAADPFKPALILSATMTNDIGSPDPPSDKLQKLAGHLGIDPEDAETFATEIIPFLNRRFALLTHAATSDEPVENRIQTILQEELPRVLANYALDDLKANKGVMLFLAKLLAPELTDLRVKQLVDRQAGQADQSLADQLADNLGIRTEQTQHFRDKVIPKLKQYTKAMYRKKVQSREPIEDSKAFNQFIIDNVFIDEFENHPYIRSVTDKNNKAILLPETKSVAMQLITAWMNEVIAEENRK
ncbi:MAG: hypothetical protein WBM78_17670 [Desulfobacterales bacterium]